MALFPAVASLCPGGCGAFWLPWLPCRFPMATLAVRWGLSVKVEFETAPPRPHCLGVFSISPFFIVAMLAMAKQTGNCILQRKKSVGRKDASSVEGTSCWDAGWKEQEGTSKPRGESSVGPAAGRFHLSKIFNPTILHRNWRLWDKWRCTSFSVQFGRHCHTSPR